MSAFFIMFTQKGINYLKQTTQLVDHISKGNLGIQIHNDRNDELGNLSSAINRMSSELKRLSDEEHRWEKAKDDMVSNISHDLRTPLTSIIGYLQLIINCENDHMESMIQYANVAYNKSLELKSLVEELFEFANISNQEFKLNKTKLDISELIKQVILGQMPALQEKILNCRSSFPDEKMYVFADAVLIARAFDNLLSNAVRYSTSGENIDVELAKEAGYVLIKITNYGTEIAQGDLPYIFEKFYCVNKSRSGSSAGVGLGLAIVKSIVEKHNGEVFVNSSNNRTTFAVRLKTDL
ncbi:MAG: sensor histidine kinase [Aminipila sp.]